MINRTGTIFAATCLVCSGGLAGQSSLGLTFSRSVDRGPSMGAIGTRLSVLFGRHNKVLTGLEFGYSKLPGVENGRPFGGNAGSSVVQFEGANRRMYHATVTARRSWLENSPAGLYVGAGTGAYLISSSNEFWQQQVGSLNRLDFQRRKSNSLQFGLNLGGGVELRPFQTAGALDLDARFHFLPCGGSAGVQSVFILSAGLSFF